MKKIVSAILVMTMVLTSVCVFGGEVNVSKEPYAFYTGFDNFDKTAQWSYNVPEGFYSRGESNAVYNQCSYNLMGVMDNTSFENPSNSRVALLAPQDDNNQAKDTATRLEKHFETTLCEGIAHMSFDMKLVDAQQNNAQMNVSLIALFSGENRDPKQYYTSWYPIAEWEAANNTDKLWFYDEVKTMNTQTKENQNVDVSDRKYHKYDVIFDYNNNTFDFYMDGKNVRHESTTGKDTTLKGFLFKVTSPQNPSALAYENITDYGYIMLDNISVNNYIENSGKVALNTSSGKTLSEKGGVFNINFAEAVDIDATASNYKAVNLNDNTEYIAQKAEKTGVSSIDITLPSMKQGRYELRYIGESKGKCSGADIGSIYFTVAPGEKSGASDGKYYFINDNFDEYTEGGMPGGWTGAGENMNTAEKWKAVSNDTGFNDGNALKIAPTDETGDMAVYYPFGEKIIAGETTEVEFDVKSNGGEWTLGLVQETSMWLYDSKVKAGTVPSSYYADSVIGVRYDGIMGCNTLDWNSEFDGRDPLNKAISDSDGNNLTLNGDEWKHIKAVVSFEDNSYTFTVDGKTYKYYLNNDNPWGGNKFSKYGYSRDYSHGIVGLKLYKKNDKTEETSNWVVFDNIQISNSTAYLSNRNYNNAYSNAEKNIAPTIQKNIQWWMVDVSFNVKNADYKYDDRWRRADWGVSTADLGNGDYCPTFAYNSATKYTSVSYFDHQIRAGKPFAVDFDAMSTDTELQWSLMLLNDHNMSIYEDNSNGSGGTAAWDDWYENNNCVLHWSNSWKGNDTGKPGDIYFGQDGYMNWTAGALNKDSNEQITFDSNKWYSYRLLVEPISEKESYYTLMVKDKTSGDYVVSKRTSSRVNSNTGWTDFFTQDTAGIGVYIPRGERNLNKADAFAKVYLDNLKVYEVDNTNIETAKPYIENVGILGIDVTDIDGTVTSYGDTETPNITTSTKSVAVNFYHPMAETAESIKNKLYLRYADTPDALGSTISFSEDKRSVIITPNNIVANDKLLLYVNAAIDFEGCSGAATMNNDYSKEITVQDSGSRYGITRFKAYQKEASGEWVPLYNASNVENPSTDLKLVVEGYAIGEEKEFDILWAKYTGDENEQLSEVERVPIKVNGSSFVQEYPIDYDSNLSLMNIFIWEHNSLTPVADKLNVK